MNNTDNLLDDPTLGAPSMDPTDPNAVPDLDEWGYDSYWSAADWITWHQAMKAAYGVPYANARFVQFWQQQTFGAAPLNNRTFDESFRQYARANGFFNDLYYGVGGVIASPLGIATDVTSAAGSLSTAIPKALDATSWLLPLVIIGGLVVLASRPVSAVSSGVRFVGRAGRTAAGFFT